MSGWIRIDERMPPVEYVHNSLTQYRCLVFTGHFVGEATYVFNGYAKSARGRAAKWERYGATQYGVTHWMELPEPPR